MHEVSHGINWFHLGSAYQNDPALFWYILTFVIFLVGFIKAVKKPLGGLLESRSRDIRNGLEEAKTAKADSLARLQAYEERLLHLDEEITRMKAEFKRQGELERDMLEKTAKATAAQIAKDTENAIAAETRVARLTLTRELIADAVKRAQAQFATGLASAQYARLQDDFVRDLRQLPN